ncbi:putative haloacid dehalogenase protein [Phaeoacremonium minimum UCRPA7]|uniref:Putative haloacid dehalogenase protein n=1 Tax=Phaeoacremonium minimum (strain UCR-PA7) TaxID=1286976 RepID=R8BVA8_PHAM7|nr:putative haloacid dehalogenase protein [Phaeoacremonium minimum UCRPA7]EOO03229.1 putative haloacid dehalogenase protein [Phaeoacremonium minimum UCRPA7]
MSNDKPFTSFKALSFDCYGTLINWEGGLEQALEPIVSQLPSDHAHSKNPNLAVQRFNDLSDEIQEEQPKLRYDINLATAAKKLAAELGVSIPESVAEAVGAGPRKWSAFPDTVAGLEILKNHFKLIILSNVNNENIKATVADNLAPVEFDAIYTAENIGSYKPSHNNFQYLFEHAKKELDIDFEKGDLLHVARSLTADHVPAKEIGLRSVWIARGGDKKEGYGVGGNYEELLAKGKVGFEWKFDTIGDFAKEVARQFGDA